MTHEDLVERVARALCNVQQPTGAWSGGSDEYREIFRHEARAAITTIAEALKEPTQGMMEAISALDQWCSIHNMGAPPTAEATWEAMHAASPLYPTVKE